MTAMNLAERMADGDPLQDVVRGPQPPADTAVIPRNAYAALFQAELDTIARLTMSKNANYAGDGDALANFRLIEHVSGGRITTADGILTRMSDKFQRIVNLLGGSTTNHESLEDNLMDLSVYALILKIHLQRGGR